MKNKLLLFFIFLFLNVNYVMASDLYQAYDYTYEDININLSSKNVILYNLTDNYKLIDIKSNDRVQIASLTKIMTTIVAIENIRNLDESIVISNDVFDGIYEYSKAGFKVGDKVTYRDLLYGVMLPSGADAVRALILNVSGSDDKFIKLMNDKVKELKLVNTNFDNAIGMDSVNNYSTASDMAVILNYALSNGEFKKIFTTKKYTVLSNNLVFNSTLNIYGKNLDTSSILGSKSGFTDGAGVCLASYASVNDVLYLLVVLGAPYNNRSNAIRDSIDIYNYIGKNYDYKVVLDSDYVVKKLDVKWGNIKEYDVKVKSDVSTYVKNTIDMDKLEYVYDGIDKIDYHIDKGDKLGSVLIKYNDKVLASSLVFLDEDIKYYHPFIYGVMLICVILMFISLIKIKKSKYRKRRRRKK